MRRSRLIWSLVTLVLLWPSPAEATFFGDEGVIAFDQWTGTSDGIDNHDVFAIRNDGTGLTDLTEAGFSQWHPQWSPDGRRMAYLSTSGLIVRDMSTGRFQLVAKHFARASNGERHVLIDSFSWSPDGTKLVFSWAQEQGYQPEEPTAEGDHSAIMVVGADGSGLKVVVPSTAVNRAPAWSPDGGLIAFERFGPNFTYATDGDIWVVRPNGKGLERVAAEGWNVAPSWTSDGRIVFVSSRDCPPFWYACDEVFEMSRSGSDVKKLIAYPTDWAGDREPDWIRNAVMSPDASELLVLVQPYAHSWEVAAPEQLWTVDLETDEKTLLVENDIWIGDMDWRPVCTVRGTPAGDVLRGTPGRDLICGGGGDDVIKGLGGDDVLFGHGGNDRVIGGAGRDIVVGNAGRDRCDVDPRDHSRVC